MNEKVTPDELFKPEAVMDCMCLSPTEQEESGCLCPLRERYLRHVMARKQTLTPEQREWCKAEILQVEGYSQEDTEHDDGNLAHTVLRAWTDFCRDKGLL